MKYIIIGLGNYGAVLAEELSMLGHEVIGADYSEQRVDAIKDKIATAFVLDATDDISLNALPLNKVDVVIVAIGENFGASVRVVALLKQRKVEHIYARAIDEVHKSILQAFNLDKILAPESDAARSLVQLMDLGTKVDSFSIDDDYYVLKFVVPSKFIGFNVNDLKFEEEFGLKIIALKQGMKVFNSLGVSIIEKNVANEFAEDYQIMPQDELVCYGRHKNFQSLWKAL